MIDLPQSNLKVNDSNTKNSIRKILDIFSSLSSKTRFNFFLMIFISTIYGIMNGLVISLIPILIDAFNLNDISKNDSFILSIIKSIFPVSQVNEYYQLTIKVFICFAIISGVMGVLQIKIRCYLIQLISQELSLNIYSSTLKLNYIDYKKINSTNFSTILTNNLEVSINTIYLFLNLISSSIISSLIIITCLSINFYFFASITLLLILFFSIIAKTLKKQFSEVSEKVSNLKIQESSLLSESYSSIKSIILSNKRNFFINIYKKLTSQLRINQTRKVFYAESPKYLLDGVLLTSIGLVIYVNSKSAESLSNTLPILAVLAISLQKLAPEINAIYRSIAVFKVNAADMKKMVDIIDYAKENSDVSTNLKYKEFKNLQQVDFDKINFRNVSFKYGDLESKNVIDDLNLTIYKNERIGVIGMTGSGKSTFLDLLMGLLIPSNGEINIDGKSIFSENFLELIKWRKSIANVPQEINITDQTIAQNIAFGIPLKEIDFDKVYECARLANLEEYINSTPNKYFTLAGERGVNLSGGQKQRLVLARALYADAKLLVLDEATSNLDEKIEDSIMKTIYAIPDKTIIIVAHRKKTLKNCDKILEFKNGHLEKIFVPSEFNKII